MRLEVALGLDGDTEVEFLVVARLGADECR